MGLQRIYRDLLLLGALLMDDAIRQAIADLSALIKDADSKDAERIREIIERLQNFDADIQGSLEHTARLHKKLYR
jgi:vacuolar-type H+-ATPase subunit H